MDQWLAQIYGTGGAEDLEKTAQHHLLQKLAEQEGVDLSGLSEEELDALAGEVLSGEEEQAAEQQVEETYEAAPTEEEQQAYLAKEAQAKFEEADFLGRVMAHAYTQELEKIATEKQAKAKWRSATGVPGKAGEGLRGKGADKARAGAKQYVGGVRKAMDAKQGPKRALDVRISARGAAAKPHSPSLKNRASGLAHKARVGLRHAGQWASKNKKMIGVGAGLAAAGAGAGYAMGKEASAFEKLAEMRAEEILQAAQAMQAMPPQVEEQVPQEEQFQAALDDRALQLLAENGYDVDSIVGQLQGDEGVEGVEEQPVEEAFEA